MRWAVTPGRLYVKSNYQFILDNLLDLTHLSFLHANTFGTPDYASAPYDSEIGRASCRERV